MNSTILSSKGQIIIPKQIRETYSWQTGIEFWVIDMGEGILLKPKQPFPVTTIAEVAGCLPYKGTPNKGAPKTIAEMDTAVAQALQTEADDGRP